MDLGKRSTSDGGDEIIHGHGFEVCQIVLANREVDLGHRLLGAPLLDGDPVIGSRGRQLRQMQAQPGFSQTLLSCGMEAPMCEARQACMTYYYHSLLLFYFTNIYYILLVSSSSSSSSFLFLLVLLSFSIL